MLAETIGHVERDEAGVAWIAGTRVKVVELVLDHLAYGWSGEEMHEHHPGLSLAQIYSALAWYHDHRDEMDREIAARREKIERLREETGEGTMQRRLRPLAKWR